MQLDFWGSGATQNIEPQTPVLRPYQQAGVNEVLSLASKGTKRILFVLPTGGGKTVCISSIISRSKGRVLFIAHRRELISQAARTLAKWDVTDQSVLVGGGKFVPAKVVVASIDTLRKRDLGSWAPSLIVIDEAHRTAADSYQSVLERWPGVFLIGLTATPFRLDNKGLGDTYEALVIGAKPSQLVTDGFIIRPIVYRGPIMPDLSEVEVRAGEYVARGLTQEMSKPKLVGSIIEEWKRHAEGRQTVAFCSSVAHAESLAESFRLEGVEAASIDGTTDAQKRALVLHKLGSGELQVVTNVDVLTEGWDQPSVKCAILARPTQSCRVHLQQVGRILRPYQNTVALILDHAGNIEKHGMADWDREYSLDKGQSRSFTTEPIHVCPQCFRTYGGRAKWPCPGCGYAEETEAREIRQDENVKLERAEYTQQDEQKAYFAKMVNRAKIEGKKPGYAGVKYKERYGAWPPWGWTEVAKKTFEADAEWQASLVERQWRAAQWKERNGE